MIKIGSRVEVIGGRLLLAKRIPAGTRGTVEGELEGEGGHLWIVVFDGDRNGDYLPPAELREIEEGGRCA